MSKQNNKNDEQIGTIAKVMVFGMWLGLLGLLTLFFYNWQQNESNPNQSIYSKVNRQGNVEIILEANRQGQYIANGFINSTPVTFLLDTGANDVSIPAHIAKKIGLNKGHKIRFETANGIAYGYKTRLDKVALGEIELKNISASINPNVTFDEILLGMSFLKHLELLQKNNSITLRY